MMDFQKFLFREVVMKKVSEKDIGIIDQNDKPIPILKHTVYCQNDCGRPIVASNFPIPHGLRHEIIENNIKCSVCEKNYAHLISEKEKKVFVKDLWNKFI